MSLFRLKRSYITAAVLLLVWYALYTSAPFHLEHLTTSSLIPRSRIQYDFDQDSQQGTRVQEDQLQAVKDEFLHSWKGYKDHAWMMDEVRPVSGGNRTKFCGWAATLVDSLDTLHIMGLEEEWELAVEAATSLNFSTLSYECSVNLFEMTIRHLGGFLAAYDIDGSKDKRLFNKTLEVGEMLFTAFNTTNGLHCSFFKWPKNEMEPCESASTMSLAGLGSLNLEFTRLSIITGDDKYSNAIGYIASEMAEMQDTSTVPGLWPTSVDATCELGLCPFVSSTYSVGASGDSTYEYVLKSHLLIGSQNRTYADMWSKAAPQIREHMLYQPMNPGNQDILFSGIVSGPEDNLYLNTETQHLSCFLGGLFGLSGKAFNNSQDLEVGKKLTNGCVWAYNTTASGIMPESFLAVTCDDQFHCPWNETRYSHNLLPVDGLPKGFTLIRDGRYLLRPEAIESVFILYRLTGDPTWREKGWEMFTRIRSATRSEHGHSALENVLNFHPMHTDEMESFWLAETLKYFYLLFSDPGLVSLDEWVLNTEAHPLRLDEGLRGF